jgi:hypothetical protein
MSNQYLSLCRLGPIARIVRPPFRLRFARSRATLPEFEQGIRATMNETVFESRKPRPHRRLGALAAREAFPFQQDHANMVMPSITTDVGPVFQDAAWGWPDSAAPSLTRHRIVKFESVSNNAPATPISSERSAFALPRMESGPIVRGSCSQDRSARGDVRTERAPFKVRHWHGWRSCYPLT